MIQQSKNYRPVSVLPIISKVFERLMHKEMSIFVESFLSLYMCLYTGNVLVHKKPYWLWLKHGKKNLIERDTINYDLLLAKLHAHGFTNKSLSLIKSPLTNHWQRTKVNKIFSRWSELLLWVPQESILGPLFFNIYLNDLFYLGECTACNYADGTAFHACDSELKGLITRLEHDSSLTIEWFQANYIKINKENVIYSYQDTSMNCCEQTSKGLKFGNVKKKKKNFWELWYIGIYVLMNIFCHSAKKLAESWACLIESANLWQLNTEEWNPLLNLGVVIVLLYGYVVLLYVMWCVEILTIA